MFKPIRRKDRIMDNAGIDRLLETGEYGFLAMNGINGYGYGIPLNFVREGDFLYFHCAPEGYKLECLAIDPRVSFCVIGRTQVIPNQFTTAYESVLVFGQIETNLPEDERRYALRLIAKKYSPEYEEIGNKYIEKSFHRTHILKLKIEHMTGKNKQINL